MGELKVDLTKLKTVENYAKEYGISKPTVYKMIDRKDLITVKIDGKLFIKI
jgi:predicted DNA-binding transcriptional regulator YafY